MIFSKKILQIIKHKIFLKKEMNLVIKIKSIIFLIRIHPEKNK